MATFSITNSLTITGNLKIDFDAETPPVDTFYLLDEEGNTLVDQNNNQLTTEEE